MAPLRLGAFKRVIVDGAIYGTSNTSSQSLPFQMIKSTPHFLIIFAHKFTFENPIFIREGFNSLLILDNNWKLSKRGKSQTNPVMANEEFSGLGSHPLRMQTKIKKEGFYLMKSLAGVFFIENKWNSEVLMRVRIEHQIPITNHSKKVVENHILENISS